MTHYEPGSTRRCGRPTRRSPTSLRVAYGEFAARRLTKIQLDTSEFGSLVKFLHDQCEWDRFELEFRLKHFEGWDDVAWSEE